MEFSKNENNEKVKKSKKPIISKQKKLENLILHISIISNLILSSSNNSITQIKIISKRKFLQIKKLTKSKISYLLILTRKHSKTIFPNFPIK